MEPSTSELEQLLSLRRETSSAVVDVNESTVKLVVFAIGSDWFAFPGTTIREIFPPVEVYFIPGCPPSLEGVINVRGDIESVIRLNTLLSRPHTPLSPDSAILLGRSSTLQSGIRVDRVIDVLDVGQSAIHAPPNTLSDAMQRIVTGLTQHQGIPVAILNLERIFADYQSGLG